MVQCSRWGMWRVTRKFVVCILACPETRSDSVPRMSTLLVYPSRNILHRTAPSMPSNICFSTRLVLMQRKRCIWARGTHPRQTRARPARSALLLSSRMSEMQSMMVSQISVGIMGVSMFDLICFLGHPVSIILWKVGRVYEHTPM